MVIPERDAPEAKPKTLLITAGAGGVGSIAIQLAKKLHHLKVIATASRPESREYCKQMGADEVIDHRNNIKVTDQAIIFDMRNLIFNYYL
jgi:NADPH2:quinone reductase